MCGRQLNIMKLVLISDTHCEHEKLIVPYGDIVIHAGDFTSTGHPQEMESFFKWFSKLPHRHKIVVPGNHEMTLCEKLEKNLVLAKNARYGDSVLKTKVTKILNKIKMARDILEDYNDRIHFLIDRSVTIEGIKFYGSPRCVGDYEVMGSWGFYTDEPKKYWDRIPPNVDILITHSPPYGILDAGLGCKELLKRVNKVNPYLHVFGHIHSMGGRQTFTEKTIFVNAAVMDDNHYVTNPKCIVHEI